jgi:hypothetical protein
LEALIPFLVGVTATLGFIALGLGVFVFNAVSPGLIRSGNTAGPGFSVRRAKCGSASKKATAKAFYFE